jgi:crossover junction endodeoxyribonuclease RusA
MGASARGEDRGMIAVSLPWPERILSPNARAHWRPKAKATEAARHLAYIYTRDFVGHTKPCWPAAAIRMVFCPPDRRRRDLDNFISSTKAHRDGIADALGTDDSKFTVSYAFGEPVKGGAVRVEITPL